MRAVIMDDARMNHYEKQLYTVFKTFDVDDEEALDRAAVIQLCDALQLEARGAALVDSLFERRAERVTFATFRNGLLSVLGASPVDPTASPAAEPAASPSAAPAAAAGLAPAHSDDDSSGREVAPKFVFGAKKYGRRSRPVRGADEPGAPRASSASRADADAARRPRTRYRRSASAMEARAEDDDDARLDHDRRIDRAQAAALCRELRMDGVDPRLVERAFDDAPGDETTVGEFFDRLNVALTAVATAGAAGPAASPGAADDDDSDDALPVEAVAEAWERAGVPRPRRLLAELGFASAAVRARDLERALDDEPRAPLRLAALAASRLRHARARARAAAAGAERDKLRADLAEANRRARLLAQDVDENLARLEAERQAAARQLEAKRAEAARAAAAEWAAERERAAAGRASLEADVARRAEAEARLRAELAALGARAELLERRAGAAEERAAGAERERARAEGRARAGAEREARAAEREREAAAALTLRLRELREDNARLRDRADELQAALEARAAAAPAAPAPAADTSWRDEAELATDPPPASGLTEVPKDFSARGESRARPSADRLDCASLVRVQDCDSSPASVERRAASPVSPGERSASGGRPGCGASAEPGGELGPRADAATQTDPDETEAAAELAELDRKHEAEKNGLNDVIAGLESGLEALRLEYERCEEYWAGKLADERAAAAEEAAAGDARLADLLRRVADYERQFHPRLPALAESALEPQYTQLAQEFEAFKAEAARELEAARRPGCSCRQSPAERAAEPRRAAPPPRHGEGDAPSARRCASAGAGRYALPATKGGAPCACAALWAGAARAGAEASALRARAAHAEHAAARLLARLHAADALVADLYRENCQLQHPLPRAPRLL